MRLGARSRILQVIGARPADFRLDRAGSSGTGGDRAGTVAAGLHAVLAAQPTPIRDVGDIQRVAGRGGTDDGIRVQVLIAVRGPAELGGGLGIVVGSPTDLVGVVVQAPVFQKNTQGIGVGAGGG